MVLMWIHWTETSEWEKMGPWEPWEPWGNAVRTGGAELPVFTACVFIGFVCYYNFTSGCIQQLAQEIPQSSTI